MHNNRYSTVEGVMRLFTVDHPPDYPKPQRGRGYPAPSPADLLCFVSTAAALSCPFMVSCGYYVVTGYELAVRHDVRLATRLFGLVQKITRRPKRALV